MDLISIAIIASTGVGLYALHRLALWAEDKGWIYYLRKRASGDTLGNAFLELHSIVQPEKKYVLEARRKEKSEDSDKAGPDHAGDAGDPSQPLRGC